MLEIKDLHAAAGEKEILRGVCLTINPGEVHAIMGPNGSGKSTLSKVVAGHPDYQVLSGDVLLEVNLRPRSLIPMEPEERSRAGVFLAFQYPTEVPGVSNRTFLHSCANAICKHQGAPELSDEAFEKLLREKLQLLDMDERFLSREVNVDFSGGEKKRNEMLQLAVLNPRLSFLDETDSGLDVDSLRAVCTGINRLRRKDNSFVLITHYDRLLRYVEPDFVHIMMQGKIVRSGGKELAQEVEKKGYDWVLQ